MTYTEPLLFVFLALALAGILRKRKSLLLLGILGLFVACWPPAEWLLCRPLDGRYPVRVFQPPPGLQAIVVFSGGVSPPTSDRPYQQPNFDTFERCAYTAWIYRSHPLPVLACGGNRFSASMRELLQQTGVSQEMIWVEDRSTNTHENALYGADILRRHGVTRVALVVDARSMPRAAACLRKEGIQVTPAPSRMRQWGPLEQELLPGWHALKGNEETLHESLGLIWYHLRGWT